MHILTALKEFWEMAKEKQEKNPSGFNFKEEINFRTFSLLFFLPLPSSHPSGNI